MNIYNTLKITLLQLYYSSHFKTKEMFHYHSTLTIASFHYSYSSLPFLPF